MADIRNFFGVVSSSSSKSKTSSTSNKKNSNGTGGKRKRHLDDDDEDFKDGGKKGKTFGSKPAKMKKTAVIYDSDSDDELLPQKRKVPASKSKSSISTKSSSTKTKSVLIPSPVKKVTTVSDFFGSSPIQRSTKVTPTKPRLASEQHEDMDFKETLEQLDQEHKTPTKSLRTDSITSSDKPSPSRRSSRIYKMEVSPAMKKGKGLASKVAEKVRANSKILVEDTPDRGQGERSGSRSDVTTVEETPVRHAAKRLKSSNATPTKERATPTKATPTKATPTKATPTKATPTKATPTKATPTKATPTKAMPSKATPIKAAVSSKTPTKATPSKATPIKATPTKARSSRATPTKTPSMTGSKEGETPDQDSASKKKGGGASYRRYLSRDGPRSLGAKEMPEGEESCLAGLTFVITGVLDYIEKDEAKNGIERMGGKVTTTVSKKTSYLVTGRDPGPAKIQKAESHGIKILTEDELFDFIRSRPGKKSSTIKKEETSPKEKPRVVKQPSPIPTQLPKPESTSHQLPSTSSQPKCEPDQSGESLLWVDKYKPHSMKQLIGQQGNRSCANKLLNWLKRWHDNNLGPNKERARFNKDDGFCFKAALLSGPPGIGKTTTAELVCKELGYETLELNASSSRSKKTLDVIMKEFLHTDSIQGYMKVKGVQSKGSEVKVHRQCLLMDEVDGMSGNEDRGGVQEFIQMIKKSHIPVICMCNDRNHPKIRSLSNHCFDLRFYRPQVKQIKGAMLSIAFKEGVSIPPLAMEHIITASNQDIRQVLHNMSMWSAGMKKLSQDQVDSDAQKAKKDLKLGPWDVLRQVFACGEEADKMSLIDKMGLFFHDYSIAPLFVQENYLSVRPKKAKGDLKKHLDLISKAADSMCQGDLVDKAIRTTQRWGLLPTQAIFASVVPGEIMKGYLKEMITFPSWLGKNSTRNKNQRLLQEIQQHMRLSAAASIKDVNFDYVPHLREFLTQPLLTRESEGVSEVVELLNSYDLTREDFDTVLEVSQFEGKRKPMAAVPSKVKAAFTRAFNKEGHMMPYAFGDVSKKRKGAVAMEDVDGYGEEEGAEPAVVEEEEDSDDDLSKNAMIKVKKTKGESSSTTTGGKGKGSKGKAPAKGRGTAKGKSKAK